jgi:hypothetical protein
MLFKATVTVTISAPDENAGMAHAWHIIDNRVKYPECTMVKAWIEPIKEATDGSQNRR